MNKADVIAFFDRCAPEWDADMIRNEPVIQTILDNAGVCAGNDSHCKEEISAGICEADLR